ncbi:phage virion morphogenesis protein [Sporomusa sphaeroides DSM 2875]|uniref:phage virion morphogenesis protein n=1 Tax=Sporomusa sphaeroides TaxID=47679 RepID=UPI00202EDCC7|nr:phage virion morphogenesis protein [Sporomusa sphaeroides]MCM0757351.1 phage virion morphogenesis protein [Sporomusa sphaeroides DSM 2875]
MSGITLTGDWKRFEKRLHKLSFLNFTGLHKEIGEALRASTQDRFRKETSPDGQKWPKSLRAEADKGKTLTDTARLKNSITYRAGPDGVELGTNLIYASVQQGNKGKETKIKAKSGKWLRFKYGGSWALKKFVTIPARPFIGISEEDIEEIKAIIKDRIEESLK